MSTQLRSQLTKAAISTFENLGFVLPEPSVDEEQAARPIAWCARVAFRGPCEGWFEVRLTDDVVTEVAANMLGIDGDVGADAKADAVGEIANVICGNVVPALGEPQDVFDLDAPVVKASEGAETAGEAVSVEFGIGWGRAMLALNVAEAPVTGGVA